MGKYVIALLAILSLSAASSVAAQARPAERPARAAALYPIPSAPGSSPAGAAAAYLARLSPAALAATGGPRLHARTSGPGTFTFVLSAKINGKTVVIGAGSKTAGGAKTITVKIAFTKAGEAALSSAKGKLRITVAAIFKPKHGKTTTAKRTVTLK